MPWVMLWEMSGEDLKWIEKEEQKLYIFKILLNLSPSQSYFGP